MTFAPTRLQVKLQATILAAAAFGLGFMAGTQPASAQSAAQIGVTVDGSQISFPGTQPVELHGSVLVPLRGVFQALGAHVDYDPDRQIVTAHKRGSTIVVPIGSSTATINGQPQQLSVPAQVMNGSTLVPLRFVAEALGDYVEWAAETHMVTITSAQEAPDVVPPPHHDVHAPDALDANTARGIVRHVNLDGRPPEIIIRSEGQDTAIPVSHDANIVRGHIGGSVHPAGLSDIQQGDHVIVHENHDGMAVRIVATF